MTIESKLDRIIELMELNLTKHETTQHQEVPAIVAPAPAPVAVQPAPAPVAAPAPAAPVQAAPACPITDQPSLVAYVMASYKEMGPVKGNQIQGVLAALGITNINEATTAHYPAIYAGVEALKAQ
jgi:hypothetical protein